MASLWSVIFRYSSIALQFVILTLISHRLDSADYGRYVFALSAVLPTYFLVGLGSSEAGVREIPALLAQGDTGAARQISGVIQTSALSCAALAILSGAVVALIQAASSGFYLALLIGIYFACNGIVFNAAQILLAWGRDHLGAFFFYPAMNIALAASIAPCLLLARHPTFQLLAIATTLGAALVAVSSLFVVWRVTRAGPVVDVATFRSTIGLGLRLSAARALYSAGLWVPTFVAGLLGSPVEAGILGTAGRVAAAVGAVNAAVRFSVRPSIARAFRVHDIGAIAKICGRIAFATTLLTLLAIVGDLLFGRQLIGAVFGSHLEITQPLTVILLIGIMFECIGGPVDEVLKMTGHEVPVLAAFGLGVSALALACVALAHLGAGPLAWVQAAYSAMVFSALIILVRRYLGVWVRPSFSWSRH